ncbi:hypothetical protein [Rhodopila sp.]
MTTTTPPAQTAPRPAPQKPSAQAAKPTGNMTFTIQKGADALPYLKR